jgi:hypothetical protein
MPKQNQPFQESFSVWRMVERGDWKLCRYRSETVHQMCVTESERVVFETQKPRRWARAVRA